MSQQSQHPGTLANLPQPPSNPDTPSEMPGTPTSTTTSLSTLSTTAIKDGHRGHIHHGSGPHTSNRFSGDYSRNPPSDPEAERNARISRLPGMMSALRGVQSSGSPGGAPQQGGMSGNPYSQSSYGNYQQHQQNQQNNPNVPVTPAYFDAAGQPRAAATKMSTVGSASATDSAYEGTTTASMTSHAGTNTETAPDLDDGDDQSMTMNLDSRDTDTDMPTTSPPASGYATGPDAMEDDEENLATRSVGTFEDRMSDYDDGRESLVGFGEGAGSTVSGPIYHRRPLPGQGQMPGGPPGWGLERSSSGMSDLLAGSGGGGLPPTSSGSVGRGGAGGGGGRDVIRDIIRREGGMLQDRDYNNGSGGNDSTPGSRESATVSNERRDARMVDGVAYDRDHNPGAGSAARVRSQFAPMDTDEFVDTTATGPLPLPQNYSSSTANRYQERPSSNQQQQPCHPYQNPFQSYQHHQQPQQGDQQQQGQQQQQPQHSQTYSEFQLRPMEVSTPITPETGEADPRRTAERMLEDNATGHDWKNV
ncbi:hypothetical protein B0T20DRAFT_347396 [Sordaria brevicollis]|uniref:Uncharacterized protein n=1 Tax=Sordaria brevicollis TaxID=83679 RepID=A0AAE0PIT0_SORBR|nr:hypothetical protein B0T20DRAFT_347396 [Sordaria brevicollis]